MCGLAEREALCDDAAVMVCAVGFLYMLRCVCESVCDPAFSEHTYIICESIGLFGLSCGSGGTIRGPAKCDTSVQSEMASIILECTALSSFIEKHPRTAAHASRYVHSSMTSACFCSNYIFFEDLE
jgi:hypothetical protein